MAAGHAGSDDGSFAALSGRDAGLKTGAPGDAGLNALPGEPAALWGMATGHAGNDDGSFAALSGSDAGLETGAPVSFPDEAR